MEEFALISDVSNLSNAQLQKISVALNFQAENHLYPYYGKSGTVSVYQKDEEIPSGVIPIRIQYEIDTKGQNGYHWQDGFGNPFVMIKYNTDFDALTLTLSHEFLETIINPKIDKFRQTSDLLLLNKKGEEYFEICDVTQAKAFSYRIGDVMVSNFVTTNYYTDLVARANVKYDFLGYVKTPGEILDGGYKSWRLSDSEVLQAFKVQGVLVYKKVTGDKVVEVSANTAQLPIVLPAFLAFLLLLYFIFKKK